MTKGISIGIIIQARMNSSRLPGKVLMRMGERTMLEYILFRLKYLRLPVKTVVATSNTPADDQVEAVCRANNVSCFRGDEKNVLKRYFDCASAEGFDQIVRLTADNPFVGVEELDNLISLHLNSNADYSHSIPSLPIGVGAEIFSMECLKKSYENGKEAHHLEHVNEYMLENPDLFRTCVLEVGKEKRIPDARLTVDTRDDYNRACYIIEHSENEYVTTSEAIRLCSQFA